MTEPDAPDPIPSAPAEPPERVRIDGPPPRQRRDFLPLLYLLGFVVLAGSLFYLYRNPSVPAGAEQEAARVDTLQQQVTALAGRLSELERQPAPAPAASANVGPLDARIAALEPQVSTLEPRIAALEPRIAALEPRLAALEPRLSELEPKLSALEQRPAPPAPPPPDFGPITTRLDTGFSKQDAELSRQGAALSKQAEELSRQGAVLAKQDEGLSKQDAALSKQAASVQELADRLGTVEGRVAAVEKQGSAVAGQLGGVVERAQRISRTQVASVALEAGQTLGEIPGAPPALVRFAYNAPPTEAGLRLSFNTAAEAAQNASQPAIMDNQPFASRLWTRAQQSVSVRQGDRVLLGDPVAGLLGRARQALEAGDLAGAVSTLEGLTGPAAAAMADWLGQARSLLEARAALVSMAARG